jgi:DNA-binding NarL/FixJ family response regulator
VQRRSDRSSHRVPAAVLTDRQREIVALIAEGAMNQAIGDRLGLTRVMVSQHIATILWQLGLASRYEIALWAIEQALPTAPSAAGAH